MARATLWSSHSCASGGSEGEYGQGAWRLTLFKAWLCCWPWAAVHPRAPTPLGPQGLVLVRGGQWVSAGLCLNANKCLLLGSGVRVCLP